MAFSPDVVRKISATASLTETPQTAHSQQSYTIRKTFINQGSSWNKICHFSTELDSSSSMPGNGDFFPFDILNFYSFDRLTLQSRFW